MFTNFRNGVASMGIPLPGGAMGPVFGKTYFVDGTNGNDDNNGRDPSRAKKTIQAALTLQIADAVTKASLGDVIYVLPGMYAESVAGDLTGCSLIGVRAFAVRIQPTDGHAFSGNLHDATISGICFDSASATDTDLAAFRATTVQDSIIENCEFCCKVNVANSTGVMIGVHATAATTTGFHRSKFRNNLIMSNGGNQVFDYGFVMGSGDADATNSNARSMWNSEISGNVINAEHQGIRLIANYAGMFGTVIRGNVITGDAANHGETDQEGIYFLDDTNATKLARLWVIDNRISSDANGIQGFTKQLIQGNIVAVGGVGTADPAGELGFGT